VAERARPDVALANHLVMGPVVVARGLEGLDVPYAVKVHGSALEYTVKPHPRFLPYAREGLAGARAVLVGSRHTAESLWAAMDDPELERRTRLGPPGVDVEQFGPREPAAARAGLEALAERVRSARAGTAGSSFARDLTAAADALAGLDPERDRLVVFVGKLIASKGMELLLAAWPLVLARVPDARLVVVGFGAFREGLEQLAADLARGELAAARATRGEDGGPLELLQAFLDGLGDAGAYVEAAAALPERVTWVGRLEHDELADLIPAAEAMVVPSTFPEAFGMVAAEAAACGTLPVVARHSGLAEVAETLAGAVPEAVRPLLGFDLGPQAVPQLAAALIGWLEAPDELRAAAREAMVAVTRERYSWEGVAKTVLAAAQGHLEDLPSP
jgi:glycosyltransferase involved in cell wall biosynthesis